MSYNEIIRSKIWKFGNCSKPIVKM